MQEPGNYIGVTCDGDVIYTNIETKEDNYEVTVGAADTECMIENADEKSSIIIDGIEYSRKDKGINIVVYENDYDYVVDAVTLKCDEKGDMKIER